MRENMDKIQINWNKTADPAYEARIKAAIEQYFGRKKPHHRVRRVPSGPTGRACRGKKIQRGGKVDGLCTERRLFTVHNFKHPRRD